MEEKGERCIKTNEMTVGKKKGGKIYIERDRPKKTGERSEE